MAQYVAMKSKGLCPLLFLISFAACFVSDAISQVNGTPEWQARGFSFRVLDATSNGSLLWVCGTDETVAVSTDAGEHWQVKHAKQGGAVLLNIDFANEKFGYAAGTGGLFLITEDGGETWSPHTAGKAAILQISFSDEKHGLIRTFASLLFTIDGGENWTIVSAGQNSEDIKHFPYTFSLVALDSSHMAIMMKEGAAQYNGQRFLVTQDSGKSWKFVDIPSTTLYSFLRVGGKYWTVGTEVIHKDQPGGGYAVPVALFSTDGEKWDHSAGDLSSCKPHMCVACTMRGCLSANGTIADLFSNKVSYRVFPPNQKLTPKWATDGSAICFVANGLECAPAKSADKPKPDDLTLPTAVAPGRLGAPLPEGPTCILCSLDRVLVDQKVQGAYTIKLALEIATNGIVNTAVADGAPTPEIKSRIERQAQEWIFEPYTKDGAPANVKLNTSVRVNVIKAR
jgi:hypothetical protein